MLPFQSLDPFRPLREPDRRRRDEERLSRSEQRTANKPKDHLTGKAPYRFESGSLQHGCGRQVLIRLLARRRLHDPVDRRESDVQRTAEYAAGALWFVSKRRIFVIGAFWEGKGSSSHQRARGFTWNTRRQALSRRFASPKSPAQLNG